MWKIFDMILSYYFCCQSQAINLMDETKGTIMYSRVNEKRTSSRKWDTTKQERNRIDWTRWWYKKDIYGEREKSKKGGNICSNLENHRLRRREHIDNKEIRAKIITRLRKRNTRGLKRSEIGRVIGTINPIPALWRHGLVINLDDCHNMKPVPTRI